MYVCKNVESMYQNELLSHVFPFVIHFKKLLHIFCVSFDKTCFICMYFCDNVNWEYICDRRLFDRILTLSSRLLPNIVFYFSKYISVCSSAIEQPIKGLRIINHHQIDRKSTMSLKYLTKICFKHIARNFTHVIR